MTPAIKAQKLSKRFPVRRAVREWLRDPLGGRWTTVLDSVTFHVEHGELVGLLGPNGAGKTTLLKVLSTLLLPTEGKAEVNGWDVTRDVYAVRRSIGYCLDTERSFYYRLTGTQNLEFFAALNDVADARDRIAEVAELLRLSNVLEEPFMSYSSGTRQRLGLARALLTDPPVVILDEPTRGLDPASADDFRRLVRGTLVDRLGKAILLVTHNLEEAESCDRALAMDRGRLVSDERDEAIALVFRRQELQGVAL